MTTFYCLIFEAPPNWRARSPYLYRPGTGWPSYAPRHWVPYLSSSTTRRVFEPASTHGLLAKLPLRLSLHIHGMNRIGNTAPNSSCIVACVSVAAGTCLSSRRLATAVSYGSTIPAFQLPWHNILFPINANSHTFKVSTRTHSMNGVLQRMGKMIFRHRCKMHRCISS
jgi:hypothetical protein